jgi:hypothetical protein
MPRQLHHQQPTALQLAFAGPAALRTCSNTSTAPAAPARPCALLDTPVTCSPTLVPAAAAAASGKGAALVADSLTPTRARYRHLDLPGSAASAQSWEPWLPPVVSTPMALTRPSTTEKLSGTFHGPPSSSLAGSAEIAGPRCAAAALIVLWALPDTSLDNDFTTCPRCAQGGLRRQPYDGRGTQPESRTRPRTTDHVTPHQTTPTPSL